MSPLVALSHEHARQRYLPVMFTEGLGLTTQELDRLAGQLRMIRKAAESVGQ